MHMIFSLIQAHNAQAYRSEHQAIFILFDLWNKIVSLFFEVEQQE